MRQIKNYQIHLWGRIYGATMEIQGEEGALFFEKTLQTKYKTSLDKGNASLLFPKFYRAMLSEEIDKKISFWLKKLDLPHPAIGYATMKSRWGSCRPIRGRITLNSDLARYPRGCSEYVLVHELLHFFHLHHNHQFYKLFDLNFPSWPKYKALLRYPRKNTLLDS